MRQPGIVSTPIDAVTAFQPVFALPLVRKTFASSFFQREKTALSGVKTQMRTCRIGAENMAQVSAQSLAMLLGEISPKISTTTVTTTVEIVAPASP